MLLFKILSSVIKNEYRIQETKNVNETIPFVKDTISSDFNMFPPL